MHIKITSEHVGVRRLYEADIMSNHYEPPGVEFSPQSRTANVVAEVGEALCERYDWLEPATEERDVDEEE